MTENIQLPRIPDTRDGRAYVVDPEVRSACGWLSLPAARCFCAASRGRASRRWPRT